jgi:hypothetical protein
MSSRPATAADSLDMAQWLWGLLALGTLVGWGLIASLLFLAHPHGDTAPLGALMHGGPALLPAGHAARTTGSLAQTRFAPTDPQIPMPSELLIAPRVKR